MVSGLPSDLSVPVPCWVSLMSSWKLQKLRPGPAFAPHLPSSSAVCLSCCGADHSLPDAPLDPAGGPRWPVFLQILPRQVEGWRGAVCGFKLWCLSSPFRLTSTFSSLGCRQAQGKGLIVQLALCVHRCRTCGCGWGRATLLHCCM